MNTRKKIGYFLIQAALILLLISPVSADNDVSSPVKAREGVVRILTLDNIIKPTWFATGSGFGVGVVGEETAVFLTNRHVIWDEKSQDISPHVYIMLDDNAVKRMYTTFGDFYDEESGQAFKLIVNPDRLVECEVLYPSKSDPAYPDFAVIRADRKIEGHYALPLLSTDEVPDASDIWTIGYPGSADKIYNTSSNGKEMFYSAEPESAQLFTGTISRRGSLKSSGDTMALTHSAQIDHGNSGGPLVEEHGRVVGINTYGYGSSETSSVGYYCSIYIDYALDKLGELDIPCNLLPDEARDSDWKAIDGGKPIPEQDEISDNIPEAKPGMRIISLNTKEVGYDKEGNVEDTFFYEYNEYGEWISIEKHDQDGNFIRRSEFILDECGERIGKRDIKEDGSIGERTEDVYDENGNILLTRNFDEDGNLESWSEYSYDSRGIITGYVHHYEDGDISKDLYDENGDVIRSTYIREDGTISMVEEWDRKPDGSVSHLKISYHDDGSVYQQTLFEYDANGSQSLYIYQKGDYYSATTYTYDEDGNVREELEFDIDGNIKEARTYTYYLDGYECTEFDENGDLKAVEIQTEDEFGEGTFKYDLEGNLLDGSKWIYDYDSAGYLVESRYYSDEILRTIYTYEPTEVKINPNEADDYWDGKTGTKKRDGSSLIDAVSSVDEDDADDVSAAEIDIEPAADPVPSDASLDSGDNESGKPREIEEDWYRLHQEYAGDEGSLSISCGEDGVLSVKVEGSDYTHLDGNDYIALTEDCRLFHDLDGLTDVIAAIGSEGEYTITLTSGEYAGTYTESKYRNAFQEDWFLSRSVFPASDSSRSLEVSVFDEMFSLELDGMHVGSFMKSRYELSPDGNSAVYKAADRNDVKLTVSKGERYTLTLDGTDYDGKYSE